MTIPGTRALISFTLPCADSGNVCLNKQAVVAAKRNCEIPFPIHPLCVSNRPQ